MNEKCSWYLEGYCNVLNRGLDEDDCYGDIPNCICNSQRLDELAHEAEDRAYDEINENKRR